MKVNKYFTGLAIGAALLSSCDMNQVPENTIDLNNGLQSVAEVSAERDGLYSFLRSRSGGGYTGVIDLQSDLFIGTMQNGNSYLAFTTGNLQSDDGDVEGIWAGCYSGLVQVNFFLTNVPGFMEEHVLTADETATVNYYLAEAKFMRGYYNYLLMNYYCGAYDEATANNAATGIPLVTEFAPSGDRSTYPGRSTLAATYESIENDLADAYAGMKAYEAANKLVKYNGYLNSYAVEALQARVALLKGDYQTAYDKAKEIVDSNEFPLATGDDYYDMWIDDDGTELIFQPFGNSAQMSSVPATGTIFNQASPVQVKFSPSAAILGAYDQDNDIRYESFFGTFDVDYNGSSLMVASFLKYPGNPAFNSGNTNAYKNLPKPFRTSEQYLILAEAAYRLNKTTEALAALNTLRAARITGYTDANYQGNTLFEQIKQERAKELCGEGFRISDLRRWKQGFTRDGNYTDYPDMAGYIINIALLVNYTDDDYRYVWPIPSYEMTTNPQLAGQQNPGY